MLVRRGVVWVWCGVVRAHTIALAAMPTDFIVIAENQYGSIDPMRRPENVRGSNKSTTCVGERQCVCVRERERVGEGCGEGCIVVR